MGNPCVSKMTPSWLANHVKGSAKVWVEKPSLWDAVEMMPEMGNPKPRLGFEIGSLQKMTVCRLFPRNFRKISDNSSVSKMAPYC